MLEETHLIVWYLLCASVPRLIHILCVTLAQHAREQIRAT
jgi:hypothetical protein